MSLAGPQQQAERDARPDKQEGAGGELSCESQAGQRRQLAEQERQDHAGRQHQP